MKYRLMMLAALACAPLVAACGTDAETADAQYNTSLIEDGVYTIGDADYDDVDVAGDKIFAVDGWGRTSIAVFDLATRELETTIAANPDFPPIVMEELDEDFDHYVFNPRFEMQGVQVDDGDEVFVWGIRDEHFTLSDMGIGPLPPWRKSFVIQSLSPDGSSVNWSMSLDLRGANEGVQIQKMTAFVEGDTIAVTYSQLNGDSFVATLPRPDGHETYQLAELSRIDMPVAPIATLERIRTPRGIGAGPDGGFVVASSEGVSTFADDLNLIAEMSFDQDFYLMDVRTVGNRAYVADLYGYLHVVSLENGEVLNSVALEIEGRSIDIEGKKLIIADTEAFQVLDIDNLPEPVEPTPVDDEEEEEPVEDEEDESSGFCWGWWCW